MCLESLEKNTKVKPKIQVVLEYQSRNISKQKFTLDKKNPVLVCESLQHNKFYLHCFRADLTRLWGNTTKWTTEDNELKWNWSQPNLRYPNICLKRQRKKPHKSASKALSQSRLEAVVFLIEVINISARALVWSSVARFC